MLYQPIGGRGVIAPWIVFFLLLERKKEKKRKGKTHKSPLIFGLNVRHYLDF
jgi:hypothetical protein